jgi:hypothetical protein
MMATMTTTGVPTMSRRALNRALLARQHLLQRSPLSGESMVRHLVALQAQNPLDPYFALAARIEAFDPAELITLLEDRAAVRTGSIRTTLHLVAADDALEMSEPVQDVHRRTFANTRFAAHVDGIDLAAIADAGRLLLRERPSTTAELATALAERWPDRERTSLAYAVRYTLPVVQIPPRGLWGRSKASTWASLEDWLGRPVADRADVDAIVLRYLAAFGPASSADARTWSWFTGLREVFERLRPRLVTVRDEAGRELFDLPDAPRPDADTPAPVRFLPEYDNLLLSHDDRSRVADIDYRERLGWKGSILIDGFLRGAWRIGKDRRAGTLTVEVFEPIDRLDRDELETEAQRLTAFAATAFGPLELRIVEAAAS